MGTQKKYENKMQMKTVLVLSHPFGTRFVISSVLT